MLDYLPYLESVLEILGTEYSVFFRSVFIKIFDSLIWEEPIPSFCYIFVFIDNIMNINCGATLYKILVLQCLWPPPIWCMETSVTLETSQFSEIMKTLRVFIPNVVEKHLPCKLRIIIVYKRLHLIFKF